MTDFTPGPWKVVDGRAVVSDTRQPICHVLHREVGVTQCEANARLVAASPALYALLKEITQELEMLGVVDNFPEWHGKAVVAFALIEKETTYD